MKTKFYIIIIMTIFYMVSFVGCGGGNGNDINADETPLPHPSFTSIGKSGGRHIVIGTDGRIFTAENNGISLVAKESGTTRDLHRVFYGHAVGVIYIIGDEGTFIKSVNGGESFTLGPSVTSEDLVVGQSSGETSIYVVSRNGNVFRSDDGEHWTKQGSLPSGVVPRSLLFNDENTGWIVGSHGAIYKTSNGGVDWTSQNSHTTRNLNSISDGPNQSLWAVGDGGTVVVTSDDGETWEMKDIGGTTKDLTFIGFLRLTGGYTAYPCYILGDGIVTRTDYAGTQWTDLTPSDHPGRYLDFIGYPLTVIGENDLIFQITQNALPPYPQQN